MNRKRTRIAAVLAGVTLTVGFCARPIPLSHGPRAGQPIYAAPVPAALAR